MTAEARAAIARRLRLQQAGCKVLGSPLYEALLASAAEDVEAGGVVWEVLNGHEHDPGPSALALRFLGAVHRLVLEGNAPELAAWYPSAGATNDPSTAWSAFQATIASNRDELRAGLKRGVQTNEVGRAGALVGGFLLAASAFGLPLRVLEVGASAGLNLRWDRFHYSAGDQSWGDPASPVDLGDPYEGTAPPFDVDAHVVERRGCDRAPVDAATDDGRLTLLSFVWPDQARRFTDLSGAIDLARRVPAVVDKSGAATWLSTQLAEPVDGVTTVVYHSVVMQYLDSLERDEVARALARAGARASTDAPLVHLAMEPQQGALLEFPVTMTVWPGGEPRVVAVAGAHGRPTRWSG